MPRNKGKKKKGKTVKPGMEKAMADKMLESLNKKTAELGLNLKVPENKQAAAAATADGDSTLDAS